MRPIRDCAIPGCGPAKIIGRGMCCKHYYRDRTYGDPLKERPVIPPFCTVEGCGDESKAKGMCQKHYLRVKNYGDPHAHPRFYASGTCEIGDCGRNTQRKGRYCGTHRARIERYGSPEPHRRRSEKRRHTEGYVMILRRGHPMAQKSGYVMEHRAVLYDAIGGGSHPCRWCSRTVEWVLGRSTKDSLVVDHLDGDRANNQIENLVPSCITCNFGRGTHWGRNWDLLAVIMDDGEKAEKRGAA